MKTYIIAECGINANGNIELAKQQIDLASACGCDAVKFQVYDTDRLYNGDTTAKSYKDSQRGWFSYKNFRVLADYTPPHMDWFAAPFDIEAVELLEDIGVKQYKIASRSVIDHELIRAIAETRKPVLMSTGSHPIETVRSAMNLLVNNEVTLLYCVTNYPTKVQDLNFARMTKMADAFKKPFGFSDHTTGIWASIEAVRLGATVIEKHFTISRNMDGCDQICSLEFPELKLLVKSVRQLETYIQSSL
jgi:N,N'-diacetyllegionaminate synthase